MSYLCEHCFCKDDTKDSDTTKHEKCCMCGTRQAAHIRPPYLPTEPHKKLWDNPFWGDISTGDPIPLQFPSMSTFQTSTL